MPKTSYITKAEILKRALEIKGIPLRNVDKTGRLNTGKGAVATVIEESWFGYKPNSDAEPDFLEAGVELKVTPYYRRAKGYRAKERLVCNIINYMEEYYKTFFESSFWKKNSTLLLMSYEHLKGQPKGDFHIDAAILFSFPEEDLIIIQHDWKKIISKIRAGKAHQLSEGDTLYLAACTKGANKKTVRKQPFSKIPAKQRAYSLKQSYMTYVLNNYIFGVVNDPKIIRNYEDLKEISFEEYILQRASKFYGKTQQELKDLFNVVSESKSLNSILLARMMGITGAINNSDEFKKANIITKTIRIQNTGKIQQNMSFPTFDFIELSQEEEWEESEIYQYLAPAKFLFVVFRENENNEFLFERVFFWNIPNEDLEQVRIVWERTRQVIREGVKLFPCRNGVGNNLPKQSENPVAHVRPHGANGEDKLPLPDGRRMTKQCFWLNNGYVKKQIEMALNEKSFVNSSH